MKAVHDQERPAIARLCRTAPATTAGLACQLSFTGEVLGEYNKTRLKEDHFPLSRVKQAFRRAHLVDENVEGGDIPTANTTRVYLLWQSIVSKAAPSQLPSELRDLLS